MTLKLKIDKQNHEAIEETLPVPCTVFIKKSINELKATHGKHVVNKKIRELLMSLIKENKAS